MSMAYAVHVSSKGAHSTASETPMDEFTSFLHSTVLPFYDNEEICCAHVPTSIAELQASRASSILEKQDATAALGATTTGVGSLAPRRYNSW